MVEQIQAEQAHVPVTASKTPAPAIFIAMFPNYWGRGGSIDEAIAAARKEGGKGRHYVVYEMPEGTTSAHVDDMGCLQWSGAKRRGDSFKLVLDRAPKGRQ